MFRSGDKRCRREPVKSTPRQNKGVGKSSGPRRDREFNARTRGPAPVNHNPTSHHPLPAKPPAPIAFANDQAPSTEHERSGPFPSQHYDSNKNPGIPLREAPPAPRHDSRSGKGAIPCNKKKNQKFPRYTYTYPICPFSRPRPEERRARLDNKAAALQKLADNCMVTCYKREEETCKASCLSIGDVVSFVSHSRHTGDTVDLQDENVSYAGVFGAAFSKFRKFIVLELFAEHVNCAPIFTFKGTGAEGRDTLLKELVHIRDQADYDEPGEIADVDGDCVYATKFPCFRGNFVAGRACVKVSERESLWIGDKCCLEGSISQEDVELLQRRSREALLLAIKT